MGSLAPCQQFPHGMFRAISPERHIRKYEALCEMAIAKLQPTCILGALNGTTPPTQTIKGVQLMSKSKDAKKQTKKVALKTPAQKKLAKREKKAKK